MKFKRGVDHRSGWWGKNEEAKRLCKKGRRNNDLAAIEEGTKDAGINGRRNGRGK